MHWLADAAGRFGARLTGLLLDVILFAGASACGLFIAKRTDKRWTGWVAGMLSFVILLVVLRDTMSAVKRVSCRGVSDYQGCVNDDYDDD